MSVDEDEDKPKAPPPGRSKAPVSVNEDEDEPFVAEADGLRLHIGSRSNTGYKGVTHNTKQSLSRPFQAQISLIGHNYIGHNCIPNHNYIGPVA